MERDSPSNLKVDPKAVLEGQVRECFGRAAYSHKTHQKCADILLERLAQIKLTQIILSALTTTSFFVVIFGNGVAGAIIGVIVSTLMLALSAYTKNYDLGELAEKHRRAANDLWLVREKYLSLLTDLRMDKDSVKSLVERRDAVMEELHSIYVGSPSTNYRAYTMAQKALQQSEELTFSDSEIDALLPSELRKENC